MAQELLKVEHLSAAYGGIHALYDISLKVDAGEIVAVLGANGAGKSTLLKCLSSEKKAAGGTITFDGKPLPPKPYQVVEEGMVIVPEGRQIFYKLSVKENLKIGCCLRKDADGIRTDFERIYAMFPRLKERESQYGGLLSGGEQQMLAIARGLMSCPKVLMLDEPSLGIAPVIVDKLFEIIAQLKKENMTILISEQNVGRVLDIGDDAIVVQSGRIVMSGTCEEIKKSDMIQKAYLGM